MQKHQSAHWSNSAVRFGLRAYDSLQLATARFGNQQFESLMAMCCLDNQLDAAAGNLGLPVISVV